MPEGQSINHTAESTLPMSVNTERGEATRQRRGPVLSQENVQPTDIFEKCYGDDGYFGVYRKSDPRGVTRPILDAIPAPEMNYQGRNYIMWSVNNYLGLAGDPSIQDAARNALETHSVSAPMGSRMMSGNTSEHIALERAFARWQNKDAAILFNFGYMGVMGTISALAGPGDTVIVDKLAHACILDAAFLSRAKLRFFRHNDPNDLESVLKSVNQGRTGGVLIAIEGVYGMTGDIAKLKEICELKERYNARLFVDDAHGVGVVGEHGRGVADFCGVQDKVDIVLGTFAKAFASIGGFAATGQEVCDWISFNARTQVFAKSLPMIYVKSLQQTLELLSRDDFRRELMWQRSNALKEGLRSLGYTVGFGESPLCAVYISTAKGHETGEKVLSYLRERGIFVTGVVYPVIPPGLVMFRLIPTAGHSEEHVAKTLEVFAEMREGLSIGAVEGGELEKIKKLYRMV
ncbi:aminotransferase class I/II-fold pyridoxal phosphate-dependent enzyme [Candidatus Haliotispira prima]|uniref:Aminotransferase class I/II-fold pyridoxal phosphate-dependent enzyme n=1 Tax=Candidatus Haliotispira prima TaxID=3034016 RepID=A0ABY8MFJ9_9SPIO|nr:aminotransferase class I/II-fold pyridoxal phosphate-dependent enzyme [Candidatus Haliotispira prima]